MDGEDHVMNGAQSPAPASTGKSIWFWLALAFSLALAWHGMAVLCGVKGARMYVNVCEGSKNGF